LNTIHVVGDRQLLQVRKHMQNFFNRWPETLKLMKNQQYIADFVGFFFTILHRKNIHELYLSFLDQQSCTEPQRAETLSRNVRQTHTFSFGSVLKTSVRCFCTFPKQSVTAWTGEQNPHRNPKYPPS
jgi:hypothetical protein